MGSSIPLRRKIAYSFAVLLLVVLYISNIKELNNETETGVVFGLIIIASIFALTVLAYGASLITLLLLCLNVLILPIMIQYITGQSYGILGFDIVPLYINKILTYVLIYNIFIFLFGIFLDFNNRERKTLSLPYLTDSLLSIQMRNIVAVVFSIVAFPRGFGQVAADQRFNMLLPGKAWNQLAIVALIFNLPYLKKFNSVRIAYLFTIFWFLSHGERADIAGLFAGLIFYWLMKQPKRLAVGQLLRKAGMILVAFVAIAGLGYVGYVRINHSWPSMSTLFSGLLTTATLSDVGYLYNVAIDYSSYVGLTHGEIFRANIMSAFPFYHSNSDFSSFIDSAYPNPGGEPLLAEPIMDFGLVGLLIIPLYDLLCLQSPLMFKSSFFKYEYLLLLCSMPRLVWYGRSYVYSSVLYFVPFIYLISTALNHSRVDETQIIS
jgi:hypothetical protein